jgi:hypothetical protein
MVFVVADEETLGVLLRNGSIMARIMETMSRIRPIIRENSPRTADPPLAAPVS